MIPTLTFQEVQQTVPGTRRGSFHGPLRSRPEETLLISFMISYINVAWYQLAVKNDALGVEDEY